MRLSIPVMSVLVLTLVLASPAVGHVPVLSGNHNSLATATQISDPAISYAIYGTLHEAGEADYYTVTLRKGDPMDFMVSTPEQGSFAPWLVVSGLGITPQGTVPEGMRSAGWRYGCCCYGCATAER